MNYYFEEIDAEDPRAEICATCGEPTVRGIHHFPEKSRDNTALKRRKCKCMRDEDEDLKKKMLAAERYEHAATIAREGYLSPQYLEPHFASDDRDMKEISDMLINYCENWQENKKQNIGIYLFGNAGSGKTFFASAIANYVREIMGDYVLMGSAADYIHETFDDFGNYRSRMKSKVESWPLMIIDDLEAEEIKESMLSKLEQIVDWRSGVKLPLIVTTNSKPKELYQDKGPSAERIKSRLSGLLVVPVFHEDRRKRKKQPQ